MQVSEFILLEPSEDNFHFYSGWFLNIINCTNILIQQVTSLPPGPYIPWDRDLAPLTAASSSYPQQRLLLFYPLPCPLVGEAPGWMSLEAPLRSSERGSGREEPPENSG